MRKPPSQLRLEYHRHDDDTGYEQGVQQVVYRIKVEQRTQQQNEQQNAQPLQKLIGTGVHGPLDYLIDQHGYYHNIKHILKADILKTADDGVDYIVKGHLHTSCTRGTEDPKYITANVRDYIIT